MARIFSPLSRELRYGLLVLLVVLIVLTAVRWLWPSAPHESVPDLALTKRERQEVAAFEARMRADSLQAVRKAQAQRDEWQAEREVRAQAKADREAAYQAQRAIWAAEKAERLAARAARQAHFDSLRALRPVKLSLGAVLDANAADTLALQRIPGIGRGYARAIVGYRERLGGFVAVHQLSEVNGLPAGIERWFRVDAHAAVRRLPLNRASFQALVHHPYLSYEQVKFIVNRRQKQGPFRSWQDFRNCPLFSPTDLERLAPYFYF